MSGAGRKLTIRMPDNPRLRGASVGRLHVDPGMRVAEGSPVLTLIVQGREHKVRAPKPGRVIPLAAPGDPAESGDPLYILNIDEAALASANRESRALVPIEKAKWSQGVTPEVIEPMIRDRRENAARRGWYARVAASWGKPMLAMALYVLGCFALLPIMRILGQGGESGEGGGWLVLSALVAFALLFAWMLNRLRGPMSGWLPRSAVHLVAISWVGLSALAIFGPPELGDDLTLEDTRQRVAAWFAPSAQDDPAPDDPAPEAAGDTELAESAPAAGIAAENAANPTRDPDPRSDGDQPDLSLVAIAPSVTSGVRTGVPLGAPVPEQVPPSSVLPEDAADSPRPHKVTIREVALVPPGTDSGRALGLVAGGEVPMVLLSSEVAVAAGAPVDLAAPDDAPAAIAAAFDLAARIVPVPAADRAGREQPVPAPGNLGPLLDTVSAAMGEVPGPAGPTDWLASAEWTGSGTPDVSLENLAAVTSVAIVEGALAVTTVPQAPAPPSGSDSAAPELGAALATLGPALVPGALNVSDTAPVGWLAEHGLPVPQTEALADSTGTEPAPLVAEAGPHPLLAGTPAALAAVADADPFAYRSLRPGLGDWMLQQADGLGSAQSEPKLAGLASGDLPPKIHTEGAVQMPAPGHGGDALAPVTLSTGPVVAALSVGISEGLSAGLLAGLSPQQPEVILDAPPQAAAVPGLPDAAPEPGTLLAAASTSEAPRIPVPEPAFDERLLLFLYFDDPRADSHPGVGDTWAPQLSPGLADAVRVARVEAVREVVQVSGWCAAADDPAASDRTAWLSDRIRLLQVRIAVEPTRIAALEAELPVFGGATPGFFHNFRPLLGGAPDAPVMARAWEYLQAAGGERAVYFDDPGRLAGALAEAGCTEAAWDGDGPANAIGRRLVDLLGG